MFRKLTLLAAIVALFVIVLGAYVRLSNAGLGCPDWPGCYGKAVVNESSQFKADAEAAFPNNPLDAGKAWKEMTHRYVAGVLSLLLLSLPVLAWRLRQQRRLALISSAGLLGLVALQALLGMWTVHMRVMPIIVTTHMLLGFVTFWAIAWTYLRLNPVAMRRPVAVGPRGFALFSMAVLFLQIVLGGWVSSNYAALACTDFPRCNGAWLPDGDYAGALTLFHGLIAGDASPLTAEARVAAHFLHRLGGAVVFVVLFLMMLAATSEEHPKPQRRSGVLLSMLLMAQILLGVLNIKYSAPLWTAVAHNGFAALLMLPLLGIYFFGKFALPGEEAPGPETDDAGVAQVEPLPVEAALEPESLFLRLRSQLKKTRGNLGNMLSRLSLGPDAGARDLIEEIEASLLMADLGIETTATIIEQLTATLGREQLRDGEQLIQALKQKLYEILQPCSQPLHVPKSGGTFVILVVGVNGAGKTTSIGKLAHRLQSEGLSVMLAAGDTFRAAAVEQLQAWGERNNVPVVAQQSGADSASVIFDALQSAKAKGIDVLIADTAGRLHTKSNLMDELKKIKRIMTKLDSAAPHEVLLILDAGTGQNALSQAKLFNEAVNLTGIALTKLDGTAKGGVIFALANQLRTPIRFVGVGEAINDLQDFDARTFVEALFTKD